MRPARRRQNLFLFLFAVALVYPFFMLSFTSFTFERIHSDCCTSTPDSIPKSRFLNTDILMKPHLDDGFTKVYCSLGEQQECWNGDRFLPMDWSIRRCVFRNLGLDKTNNTSPVFIFHRNVRNEIAWDFNFGHLNTTIDPQVFHDAYGISMKFQSNPYSDMNYSFPTPHSSFVFSHLPDSISNMHLFAWQLVESIVNAGMIALDNQFVFWGSDSFVPPSLWTQIFSRFPLVHISELDNNRTLLPLVTFTNVYRERPPFSQENVARIFFERTVELQRWKKLRHPAARPPVIKVLGLDMYMFPGFSFKPILYPVTLSEIYHADILLVSGSESYYSVYLSPGSTAILILRNDTTDDIPWLSSFSHFHMQRLRVASPHELLESELRHLLHSIQHGLRLKGFSEETTYLS